MSTELVQFDQLKADVTLFVAPTSQIAVHDKETNEVALDVLRKVKSFVKQIDDKRKELTKPFKDRVDQIDDYANEIKAPLMQAEKEIKKKMSDYAVADAQKREMAQREIQARLEADRKRAEEERRKVEAEAKAKALDEQRALAAFGVSDPEAEKLAEKARLQKMAQLDREQKDREGKAAYEAKLLEESRPKNTRQNLKFEILDAQAIPREFLMPNPAAIDAAGRAKKEVPGVRFYFDTTIVARGA